MQHVVPDAARTSRSRWPSSSATCKSRWARILASSSRPRKTTNEAGYTVLRLVVHGTVSQLPIEWIYYLIEDDKGQGVSLAFTYRAGPGEPLRRGRSHAGEQLAAGRADGHDRGQADQGETSAAGRRSRWPVGRLGFPSGCLRSRLHAYKSCTSFRACAMPHDSPRLERPLAAGRVDSDFADRACPRGRRSWPSIGALEAFAPLEPRSELLWAIDHHDDGWSGWDAAPGVDPHERTTAIVHRNGAAPIRWRSGRRRSKRPVGPARSRPMSWPVTFAPWRGESAAWMNDEIRKRQAEQFIDEYETLMVALAGSLAVRRSAANTHKLAELALSQLQFFDALSLWFCCSRGQRGRRGSRPPPGQSCRCAPLDPRARRALAPGRLHVPSMNLEVHGRPVPARRYASRDESGRRSVKTGSIALAVATRPAKS